MEGLLNQVRRAAQESAQNRAVTRHGIVKSYDPDNHAVKVELQPDGLLTGWLPLKSLCAGNGWGVYAPPAIGTAIEVHFQEADGGVGTAGQSFFNDEDRPLAVPAGEIWLAHANGASIKLQNDGTMTLDDGHGASIRFGGDGTITSAATQWNHTGPIAVTDGDITTNQDVIADSISLKTHTHGGVQTGSGDTGGPE